MFLLPDSAILHRSDLKFLAVSVFLFLEKTVSRDCFPCTCVTVTARLNPPRFGYAL